MQTKLVVQKRLLKPMKQIYLSVNVTKEEQKHISIVGSVCHENKKVFMQVEESNRNMETPKQKSYFC